MADCSIQKDIGKKNTCAIVTRLGRSQKVSVRNVAKGKFLTVSLGAASVMADAKNESANTECGSVNIFQTLELR